MLELAAQVREEFQIPPYFPDEGLTRYLEEGEARLLFLNPIANKQDKTYIMLLKNYAYYAYHHKVHEWEENYKNLIVSWQLGSEV